MLHITPWERTALQLLAEGGASGALAERFGTSEADFDVRLTALFARMGVRSRPEAVAAAFTRGLLTSPPFGRCALPPSGPLETTAALRHTASERGPWGHSAQVPARRAS